MEKRLLILRAGGLVLARALRIGDWPVGLGLGRLDAGGRAIAQVKRPALAAAGGEQHDDANGKEGAAHDAE